MLYIVNLLWCPYANVERCTHSVQQRDIEQNMIITITINARPTTARPATKKQTAAELVLVCFVSVGADDVALASDVLFDDGADVPFVAVAAACAAVVSFGTRPT